MAWLHTLPSFRSAISPAPPAQLSPWGSVPIVPILQDLYKSGQNSSAPSSRFKPLVYPLKELVKSTQRKMWLTINTDEMYRG